jgi:sugar lactone lactonase YvrE
MRQNPKARPSTRRRTIAAAASLMACSALVPATAGAAVKVVARGLDNPRGITVAPDGRLYVAEAGRGGEAPCVPGPEGGDVCFGTSGAIRRIDLKTGRSTRVVKGLPSLAAKDGTRAIGPSDISFSSRSRAYVTVGLGADPALRAKLPAAGGRAATLLRMTPATGALQRVVDLGAFEAQSNPDAGQPSAEADTNPNSVVATSTGRIVVADAGGNDILRVTPAGKVSVLAVLPFGTAAMPGMPGQMVPVQPVPTSVVRGPDGAYYAGQLTGFPFPEGAANVWRIRPGSQPEVYAKGLTQISDIAFGSDGSLYVLEIAKSSMAGAPSPGALLRLRPAGQAQELAAGTLESPTGLAVDGRYAYVSNHGTAAGGGEVDRIPLP